MRGFGNLGNLGSMGNIMKQAQKMMEQAKQIEDELADATVEGSAGGGMVTAQATGLGKIVAIKIDPQVVDPDDVEMLQDLVLSAVHEALEKSDELKQERQKQLVGGMGLPPGLF